jgi:hypothetical protein
MHYDRTVIAYHGCEAETAERILAGEPFRRSENDFDWLGHGVYLWEYGIDRALRWAQKKCTAPAVVGAIVQLGNCFDLLDTRATDELAQWAQLFADTVHDAGMPRNVGSTPDLGGRRLDCASVNYALEQLAEGGTSYDTVRCAFVEGPPVFERGEARTEIRRESHVQIAVRNASCIVGTFRPHLAGSRGGNAP